MSIYIKGMKIPKVGVYTCELDVLDDNTAVLTIYTPIDEPQRSYKLTPIPEGHGRLVDEKSVRWAIDDIVLEIANRTGRVGMTKDETMEYINNLCTIVPAEK